MINIPSPAATDAEKKMAAMLVRFILAVDGRIGDTSWSKLADDARLLLRSYGLESIPLDEEKI